MPREIGADSQIVGEPKYQLPSFGNIVIDSRSLPLSYNHHKIQKNLEPDPHVLCDFPDCNDNTTTQIERLACFHTCHLRCLEKHGNLCPICKDPLLKRLNNLTDSFNKGLLDSNANKNSCSRVESNDSQNNGQSDINTSHNTDFYRSDDWDNKINRSLENLIIPQPSMPHKATQRNRAGTERAPTSIRQNHCSYCGQPGHRRSRSSRITCPNLLRSQKPPQQAAPSTEPPPQSQMSNTPAHAPSQSSKLQVPPSKAHLVTFWELPVYLSQSTIGGRQGSNACTVISLLLAKTYLNNKALMQQHSSKCMNQSWIITFISCMMGGNHVYDTHIFTPTYLGVQEAIPLVRNSLGNLSYEEEVTVCFVKEPTAAEESALSSQLSRRLSSTNAAFVIINSLTISFVSGSGDGIIVMDSHLHFPKGALLAKCSRNDIEHLLQWLKNKLSSTVNLCTVTFINFT